MEVLVVHGVVAEPGSYSSTVVRKGLALLAPPMAYILLPTTPTANSLRPVGIGAFVTQTISTVKEMEAVLDMAMLAVKSVAVIVAVPPWVDLTVNVACPDVLVVAEEGTIVVA
jgi:hypothetical protein